MARSLLLVLLLVALAADPLWAANGWFGAPGASRLFSRLPLSNASGKATDTDQVVKPTDNLTTSPTPTTIDNSAASRAAEKLLSRLVVASVRRHAPRIRFG